MKRSFAMTMAWFALALAVAACDEGPARSFIEIMLVTPAGESPVDGVDAIAVTVRQGIDAPQVATGEVTADGFMLDLPLVDFTRPVDIAVELTGGSTRLVGGAPELIPAETGRTGDPAGLVVIAVGPPRTCAIVDGMTLEVPRAYAGVSQQRTYAAVVGGESAAGPSGAASFFDLLRLGVQLDEEPPVSMTLDDLIPVGRAIAQPISLARALILSEAQAPFLYDITGACPDGGEPTCSVAPAPTDLHAGTSRASATVTLRQGGVVIAGGDATGTSSDQVSWIDGDGRVESRRLATPRAGAQAVELGGDNERILITGGEAPGEPFAELIVRGAPTGTPVMGARPGPSRIGGALFADDADGALLVGGVDELGVPVAETIRIISCDTRCALAAGPLFARARAGAFAAPRRVGGGLVLGGDGPVALVDEVRFDPDGMAHIEPHADLTTPRSGATPLVLHNGVVFVVGGMGPTGPLGDVEVCFPETVALP